MKKEELLEIGLTEEQANKVFAMNGVDVEREKAKTTQAKADLADAQAQLTQRDKDLEELKKTSGDAAAIQQKLDELQSKYDTETKQYQDQIAARDYADALARAVSKVTNGVKWTAAAAGREFEASLKEKKLELKDGELQGAEEFFKSWKEANPDAFAPDKPAARLTGQTVSGGAPSGTEEPENVALARQMGETRAASLKASSEAIKKFF